MGFVSIPQLSQRVDRKLFCDWENAELYNNGDVSDLFGVRIGKPCEELSGNIESVNFLEKEAFDKELLNKNGFLSRAEAAKIIYEIIK